MTFAITWILIFTLGASTVSVAEFSGANAMLDCIANAKHLGDKDPFRTWAPKCIPIERTR